METRTWIPIKPGAEEGAEIRKQVQQSGLTTLREQAIDTEQRASTIVTLEASGVWKSKYTYAKKHFDVLTVPNGSVTSDEGAPEIPQEGVFVALPDGARDVHVKVLHKSMQALPGQWSLRPAPNPVTETEYLAGKQHFEPNKAIYGAEADYPGRFVDLLGLRQVEGVTVAHLRVYLAQYRPALKTLSLVKSLSLEVSFTAPRQSDVASLATRARPMLSDLILDVENAQHMQQAPDTWPIQPGPESTPAPEGADAPQLKRPDIVCNYVIITPTVMQSKVAPLYHAKCGWPYYAMVATTETIVAEFPQANLKESIRAFLDYARTQWRSPVMYVVLAGDVDLIPVHHWVVGNTDFASDHYYADFSGTIAPELIVSRIPTSNGDVMQQICQYLADYPNLRGPDWSGWVNEALLVAYEAPVYQSCSDEIANMIGPRYKITKRYGGSSSKQQVKDEINQGVLFANYRGHGSKNTWASSNGLSTADVPSLTDDKMPPMVINVACENAWFDDQGTECLAESFLRNRKAVAVIGATRDSPTGANDDLDKYFFRAILNHGEVEAGRIFYRAKWLMVLNHAGSVQHEQDVVMYELFGDPTAMVASSANFLLGQWDMEHDGWQGELNIWRVWPHQVEMIGGVGYPVWSFDGQYTGSDGKKYSMAGKIGGKDSNDLNPGTKRIDRHIEFKITFAPDNVQSFQGYVAGWTHNTMAGFTWWSNYPFEWNAKKRAKDSAMNISPTTDQPDYEQPAKARLVTQAIAERS